MTEKGLGGCRNPSLQSWGMDSGLQQHGWWEILKKIPYKHVETPGTIHQAFGFKSTVKLVRKWDSQAARKKVETRVASRRWRMGLLGASADPGSLVLCGGTTGLLGWELRPWRKLGVSNIYILKSKVGLGKKNPSSSKKKANQETSLFQPR